MTKKRKLIRNTVVLLVLAFIYLMRSGASLTPLTAHKRLERASNYGPSTIVKAEKIKGGMVYLCRYDKWFSINTVKRGKLGLWYATPFSYPDTVNYDKPIILTYRQTKINDDCVVFNYFGIVKNPEIKSVRMEFKDWFQPVYKSLEQKELYDDMFLLIDYANYQPCKLIGFDKDGKVVYEETLD